MMSWKGLLTLTLVELSTPPSLRHPLAYSHLHNHIMSVISIYFQKISYNPQEFIIQCGSYMRGDYMQLLLLAKTAKYVSIICFIASLMGFVSVSYMLNQVDWSELAYICMINIPAIFLIVKVEKYLKQRNSLIN